MFMKKWSVLKLNKERATQVSKEYDLPMLISMLLDVRGITRKEDIEDFLFNESEIADPFEIKDMDKAVERIKRAIDDFESVCVYGDYDADGVTSTALLYSYLETVGANVSYYIPSREKEGYGLNNDAVKKLSEKGVSLIITVDNGISAGDVIEYAKSLSIDTVITDHHMPPSVLPNACAVVDLHRNDCNSKFKELSGVGVVFKLLMALEGEYCDVMSLLDNYSDIACLGTIGDIVSLRGENRVIVKNGLRNLKNTEKCGLLAILNESGLSERKISAGNVAFTIVPRINACGRLGLCENSVSLLLTEDEQYADEIAKKLGEDNAKRQSIEKEIVSAIEKRIADDPRIVRDSIIVIDGENWHQGVIGIVAARVKEAFNKPCIIISKENGEAKASGRSIEGFALCDALFACSDLLEKYGGHPMAVGCSLKSDNIEKFRIKINEYANSQQQMPLPELVTDAKLNPAALDVELAKQLTYMEPFGAGNPTPIFAVCNMQITQIKPLANNKHLRLTLKRDNTQITALRFSVSTQQFPYRVGDVVDLAVTLDQNEYNGNVSLTLIIKDIKLSNADNERMIKESRLYDKLCCDFPLSQKQALYLYPNRNDFALVYRYLRQNGGFDFPIDILVMRLENKVNYAKVCVILDALRETGLINYTLRFNGVSIKILDANGKVDLENAPIMQKIRRLCTNAQN